MDKLLYILLLNINLKLCVVFEFFIINCMYNVNILGIYNNLFVRLIVLDNYFYFNLKKICI